MLYPTTVGGSEIRRSPVEVGSSSHYLRRVLAPSQVVGNGNSEPSTVSPTGAHSTDSNAGFNRNCFRKVT